MTESVSMFGCIPGPKVGNPEPFLEVTFKECRELEKGFNVEIDGATFFVRIVLVLTSGMYTYTYIHVFINLCTQVIIDGFRILHAICSSRLIVRVISAMLHFGSTSTFTKVIIIHGTKNYSDFLI